MVFAPLAIAVSLLERGDGLTAALSWTFLGCRIAHAIIDTAGVPLLRTIAFFGGFICQLGLALRLLGL